MSAAAAVLAEVITDTHRRLAPSAEIAICRDGEVVARETWGAPEGAVYPIASLTKSFLAATALRLHREGRINLDLPITTALPGLVLHGLAGVAPSLRLLLSNGGGLGEDNPWADDHLGLRRDHFDALISRGLRLIQPPGDGYRYSNLGMALVARAIECTTGNGIEGLIRDATIAPLALDHTAFDPADIPPDTHLVTGSRTFDDGASFIPAPAVVSGALGAIGALRSRCDDLAHWMHALHAGHPRWPIDDDDRRAMRRIHTPIPRLGDRFGDRPLDNAGYGHGLFVEQHSRFGHIVQHSGGLPGASSHLRWHEASGWGVVALASSDMVSTARIATSALDRLLDIDDAPAAIMHAWPETTLAADRVDRVLRSGASLGTITGCAANVFTDVPAPIRDSRLGALLQKTGPILTSAPSLNQRILAVPDPATVRWSIPCQRGALAVEIAMIPLADPVVQSLEISDAGVERTPRVSDFYRPG